MQAQILNTNTLVGSWEKQKKKKEMGEIFNYMLYTVLGFHKDQNPATPRISF